MRETAFSWPRAAPPGFNPPGAPCPLQSGWCSQDMPWSLVPGHLFGTWWLLGQWAGGRCGLRPLWRVRAGIDAVEFRGVSLGSAS